MTQSALTYSNMALAFLFTSIIDCCATGPAGLRLESGAPIFVTIDMYHTHAQSTSKLYIAEYKNKTDQTD